MVTHLDVTRRDIEKAAEIVASALAVRDIRRRKQIRIPGCGGSSCHRAVARRAAASDGAGAASPAILRSSSAASPSARSSTTIGSSASSAPRPSTSRISDSISRRSGRPRTTVYELSVSRDPSAKDGGDVPRRADAAIGERAPGAKESGNRVHRSENRHARAAGVSARARISGATGSPSQTRLAALRARARSISIETPPERVRIKWEGNCFEAEGGGAQGARLVRSETLRRAAGRCPAVEAVSRSAAGRGLSACGRPSEWRNLKRRSGSRRWISSNPTRP